MISIMGLKERKGGAGGDKSAVKPEYEADRVREIGRNGK